MTDPTPQTHSDLDAVLGLDTEDDYGKLRARLADADDKLLEDLVIMRKCKRMSQSDVAALMQRSKTAVSNFERLGSDPHLSTIRRYAAAVGALVTHTVEDYDSWRHLGHPPLEIRHRYVSRGIDTKRDDSEGADWAAFERVDLIAERA